MWIDCRWGTKEQTESEVDLGIAAMAGTDEVEIVLPTGQADVGASLSLLHSTLPSLHSTLTLSIFLSFRTSTLSHCLNLFSLPPPLE